VLDQMVNIPELLARGGLVRSKQAGIYAVSRGQVRIEKWTIGVSEVTLPRWVLRGVTITVGQNSIHISECGYKIKRKPERPLALA
jgi:hypothetical protein